jgi:hypothetical protein
MLISLSLRFLFVERRNGRPRIKMAEKGSPSMTSTLFCFPPPCYFVFRHLYKTSAEKEEDIYFPDGRYIFFSQRSRRRRLSFVTAPGGVVVVVTAAFF